jgi:hypothetical protein
VSQPSNDNPSTGPAAPRSEMPELSVDTAPDAGTPPLAGAAAAPADLPARAGRYRIEGEIARGGMGVVLCRDTHHGLCSRGTLEVPASTPCTGRPR